MSVKSAIVISTKKGRLQMELKTVEEIEKEGNKIAVGEERYELLAAFGDECDCVVDIFTGQKKYFHYI